MEIFCEMNITLNKCQESLQMQEINPLQPGGVSILPIEKQHQTVMS